MSVIIEIGYCAECPYCESDRTYSDDYATYNRDLFCDKEWRKIADNVEFESQVPIPDWCPLRK